MWLNVAYPLTTTFLDYCDNESQAILIYILGCNNMCGGCHNTRFKDKEYQDSETKKLDILALYDKIVEQAQKNNTDKVVLSGGDPLYKENLAETKTLLHLLKKKGLKITVYTGHDIDYVKLNNVKHFDFIKCGPYMEIFKQPSIKTDEYIQLSSSNQEIYNHKYELLSHNGIFKF